MNKRILDIANKIIFEPVGIDKEKIYKKFEYKWFRRGIGKSSTDINYSMETKLLQYIIVIFLMKLVLKN